jgi:mono/diheme cytochrome c family protein
MTRLTNEAYARRKARMGAMKRNRLRLGLPLAMIAVCVAGIAQAEGVDYERDIKPVLKARCYACHGALKQEAGLRVDRGESIRQGGDSGAAVTAGQPDESLLVERVSANEAGERMPPEGEPLSAEQIEVLRAWIRDGAKSPESAQAEADLREH